MSGNDDYHNNSRPVPDPPVDDAWIPTALYNQAVALYEAKNSNSMEFLESAVCPTHIRKLQPLAKAPTIKFRTDRMMPGFCEEHMYDIGQYFIGRVQLQTSEKQWCNLALVVNEGNADCNTGHWGGAFLIESDLSLTPMAWIRSVGDTVTFVEQAKNLSKALLSSFNNATMVNLEFDSSPFINPRYDEEDVFPEGLFGQSLLPGVCKTVLEKLVGAAYGQMMLLDFYGNKVVDIPKA